MKSLRRGEIYCCILFGSAPRTVACKKRTPVQRGRKGIFCEYMCSPSPALCPPPPLFIFRLNPNMHFSWPQWGFSPANAVLFNCNNICRGQKLKLHLPAFLAISAYIFITAMQRVSDRATRRMSDVKLIRHVVRLPPCSLNRKHWIQKTVATWKYSRRVQTKRPIKLEQLFSQAKAFNWITPPSASCVKKMKQNLK